MVDPANLLTMIMKIANVRGRDRPSEDCEKQKKDVLEFCSVKFKVKSAINT